MKNEFQQFRQCVINFVNTWEIFFFDNILHDLNVQKDSNYNNKLMIIRDVLDKSIKNKCLKIIANGKYQRIKKIKY